MTHVRGNVMLGWCAGLILAVPSVTMAAAAGGGGGGYLIADAAKQQNKVAIRALLKERADVNAPQADGATALHWASHWDDMESVELLLKAGANVNAKNDYEVTPLWLATENGSLVAVQRLLKAGANPNAAISTGETPLMTAVRVGSIPVVKALLAAHANVNAQAGGGREQTALMWAVEQHQIEIVKVLIANKADVNARSEARPEYVTFSRGNPQGGRLTGIADQTLESDGTRPGLRWIKKGGMTALMLAARDGDLESAKLLVAAGAHINDFNPVGKTSLMLAARNDKTPVALWLLEKGADPNIAEAGHTALHLAVARKNFELVQALIAHGANPNVRLTKGEPDPDGNLRFNQLPEYLLGATPFLLATGLNDNDTMLALVKAGADITIPMEDGTTTVMASMGIFPGVFTFIPFTKIPPGGAAGDNTAYFQRKKLFAEAKVLETMKLVVELGGDVNGARGNLTTYHVGNSRTLVGRDVGDTALHIATADKYPTVVEFLVSKGAKMDVKDRRGLTPLGIAKAPGRQFITGGDNGEKIGDPKMVAVLEKLGAPQ
jgi:ankyrin repeat protein